MQHSGTCILVLQVTLAPTWTQHTQRPFIGPNYYPETQRVAWGGRDRIYDDHKQTTFIRQEQMEEYAIVNRPGAEDLVQGPSAEKHRNEREGQSAEWRKARRRSSHLSRFPHPHLFGGDRKYQESRGLTVTSNHDLAVTSTQTPTIRLSASNNLYAACSPYPL